MEPPLGRSFKGGGAGVNTSGFSEGCRRREACLMRGPMADIRAMEAIDRLERALARVEAAAAKKSGPEPRSDSELIELRQVHQALRSKVEGAILQIDRMLEAGERV